MWLLVHRARDFAALVASRVLAGLCFGGVLALSIVATAEYTAPAVRGPCLAVVTGAGPAAGTLLGHALGALLPWRTVALLGAAPAGLAALLPCLWVESPSWLAARGRFADCERAFRALHGDADRAELELLLRVERAKARGGAERSAFDTADVRRAIGRRYFWRIALLCAVVNVYRVFAGRVVFNTLAVGALREMTGAADVLPVVLLVDGCGLAGAAAGGLLAGRVGMRPLLFSAGLLADALLVALAACLHLGAARPSGSLLALYFVAVNAGPYPVLETLFGEMFPLEIKGACVFLFGCVGGGMHFSGVWAAEALFAALGHPGALLLCAGVTAGCLGFFWLRLPETRGRTLQEIELFFKDGAFAPADAVLPDRQEQVLL